MRITLKIRSYCSQPPTDPQVRAFDSFPIIVGRSSACDYILNDASRYISSNHAVILLEGDKLLIQDTSANGVYINGDAEPVGRGQNSELNNEDALAIGDYTLSVAIESASSSAPMNSVDDPFGDFATSSSGQSATPAIEAFDPFRGAEPDWTPASSHTDDPFSDDWNVNEKNDWNFDDKPASTQDSPPASADTDWSDWPSDKSSFEESNLARTPHDSGAAAPSSSATDDFDWLPGTSDETVSIPGPLPGVRRSKEPQGRPTLQPRQTPRSPKSPFSNINQPPAAYPGSTPSSDAQARPPTPRRAASQNASTSPLGTLLNAASLRESDFAHRNNEEILEQTGRLLAQMTEAIMVLLQSRVELKNAIRSDVTTLSRKGNNPLKFSISSSDALTKLLASNNDGYLQSEQAIQEAVDDLKLHQLAMLEGMKSAVKSLLSEFDPDKLADTLGKSGGISANIPITRDAKLWQLFCNQYDTICEEAVGDFGDLFGTEFRKAYETSIKKAGRRPDF